jgi:hypothetical protein
MGSVSAYNFLRAARDPAAGKRTQIVIDFGLIVVSALVLSLPLLVTIVGRYRLHTLNVAPGSWVYDPLLMNNFGAFLKMAIVNQPLLVAGAALGVIVLARRQDRRIERAIVLLWTLIAALLLGYSYLGQVAQQNGLTLPSIVPGFHFVFYLKAALAVLFGIGLLRACRFAAAILARDRAGWSVHTDKIAHTALSLTLAILFAINLSFYLAREDFTTLRDSALAIGAQHDKIAAYEWVRHNTRPDTVFLSSDHLVTFVVGPAGRKVVAANQFFSNPYVDWQARSQDRDAMYAALESGDQTRYSQLAQKYGVAWIIASGNRVSSIDAGAAAFLDKVFSDGRVSVYRLRTP